MKAFGLKQGTNYIDNDYGHIYGVKSGIIKRIEVYSNSLGSVAINHNPSGMDKTYEVVTITVGADFHGSATTLDYPFGYGDTITVSGLPVESGNNYSIRCFYE